MTPRHRDFLAFLETFTAATGTSPSYAEIQTALGLSSKREVFRMASALIERGLIRREGGRARSLVLVTAESEFERGRRYERCDGAAMSDLILTDTDGRKRGVDPREMTGEQLEAAGIERRPVLAAIRAKCLDCCCGLTSEVSACTSETCPLWPYRMNHNPFRTARKMPEEQRQAAGERLAKARASRLAQ